jgi:hypothetical protein
MEALRGGARDLQRHEQAPPGAEVFVNSLLKDGLRKGSLCGEAAVLYTWTLAKL